jgi:methionyl-tRNA formyltransferase
VKIVFAGTPGFAATALDAIIGAGHAVVGVLTQPDRPVGRGQRVGASPVKVFAEKHGLPVLQPVALADPAVVETIRALRADAMVVAAYGLLVPRSMLELPPHGCINIHASLLPRWRGAAPIQRALLAGDETTGITIMQMDEGLDTGPLLLQQTLPITPEDTAGTLGDRLAALGAKLVVEALAAPRAPWLQDPEHATYAPKIDRSEAAIHWRDSAAAIDRQVRAFNPAPGAYTSWNGALLKIWRARVEEGAARDAGVVRAADPAGIVVACGAGALRILELQRAGGRPLPARAFLAGCSIVPGARLGE